MSAFTLCPVLTPTPSVLATFCIPSPAGGEFHLIFTLGQGTGIDLPDRIMKTGLYLIEQIADIGQVVTAAGRMFQIQGFRLAFSDRAAIDPVHQRP